MTFRKGIYGDFVCFVPFVVTRLGFLLSQG